MSTLFYLVKDKTDLACWRLPAAEAGEAAP